MKKIKPVAELLFFFVNPNDKSKLTSILSSYKPLLQLTFQGKGVIGTDASSFWGFGVEDREVVVALVPINLSKEILNLADTQFDFKNKNHGIAFSTPIQSATTILKSLFTLKGDNK